MTTLKTSLLSYKKTELESYAKTLGIKRISSLKKAEIAEKVADELLNPEVMAKRLAILDDAQIALFEKAAKGAFMATEAEMDTAYEACALDYMQVSEERMLEVTEDVAEAYEKMDRETFEKKRKEVSWLAKCLSFSAAMYGVAPVDTVRTVYESRPHYHADKETFMALFDEIPYEINPCVISEDVIMDRKLIAGDAYEALLNEQQGKKFYVPSWQQVEELATKGCLLDEASYKKLFAFFQKELSKCIRCNACRNVCPACSCRKCVFDSNKFDSAQKANVDSFEEKMFHIIRAFHVAGRCTDCGECSRVCPQGIPLHLFNRKFIKDIDTFYGEYQAGEDSTSKGPLTNFTFEDAEPSIVTERG